MQSGKAMILLLCLFMWYHMTLPGSTSGFIKISSCLIPSPSSLSPLSRVPPPSPQSCGGLLLPPAATSQWLTLTLNFTCIVYIVHIHIYTHMVVPWTMAWYRPEESHVAQKNCYELSIGVGDKSFFSISKIFR